MPRKNTVAVFVQSASSSAAAVRFSEITDTALTDWLQAVGTAGKRAPSQTLGSAVLLAEVSGLIHESTHSNSFGLKLAHDFK